MSENLRQQFESLPGMLAPHLLLTAIALTSGILISVPLAVAVVRRRTLRYPTLTVAGVIQTVPSLALLALMVPLLEMTRGLGVGLAAFGFWPAVIALTLYSILPILRNTVTGILGIDAALIEAARGVGMTDRQTLLKVQLPLAAPMILAGIRTAGVWVVGIATLATPVGQRCLGNYIFAGLQTRNWTMVTFGVVAAAAVAIVLDLLIAGLQRSAEARRPAMGAAVALATMALLAAGLAWPHVRTASRHDAVAAQAPGARDLGMIRIGAKTFTEQYILAATLDRALADAGYDTHTLESLGSTIVFDQLRAGHLDVYVDYSGTIWINAMKRRGHSSPRHVLDEITWWLAAEHRIRCLGALGFENTYAVAMRRDRAEQMGVRTIADLASHSAAMTIGGDYEFFGRPEWRSLRDTYGLAFDDEMSLDSTLMYGAVAGGQVDAIVAFSSDGRIAAYDLVTLADPQQVIPPYDAVLLLGPRVADDPNLIAALRPLLGAVDLVTMRQLNHRVDQGQATPRQAGQALLDSIN